jgi:hypothetical protein
VVALIWLLSLTHAIVVPLIAATVVAAVAAPLVRWLGEHHVPRGLGAALVLVGLIALAVGVVVIVLAGITSQDDAARGPVRRGRADPRRTADVGGHAHRRRSHAGTARSRPAAVACVTAFSILSSSRSADPPAAEHPGPGGAHPSFAVAHTTASHRCAGWRAGA